MALEITDASLKQLLSENEIVVLDFWAPWCGPCKTLGPIMDELADENANKATIGKINVDHNKESAMQFSIRSIPTIIFFKKGMVIDRITGMCNKPTLQEKIDTLLTS